MLNFCLGFLVAICLVIAFYPAQKKLFYRFMTITEFRPELRPVYEYAAGSLELAAALDEYDRLVYHQEKKGEIWHQSKSSDGQEH
jgi:hypothetical protein